MKNQNNFEAIGQKIETIAKELFHRVNMRIEGGFNFNKTIVAPRDILGLTAVQQEFEEMNPVGIQLLRNVTEDGFLNKRLEEIGKEMREDMGETNFAMFLLATNANNEKEIARELVYYNLVIAVMQKVHGHDVTFNAYVERTYALKAQQDEERERRSEMVGNSLLSLIVEILNQHDISEAEGIELEEYGVNLLEASQDENGGIKETSKMGKAVQVFIQHPDNLDLIPELVTAKIESGGLSMMDAVMNADEIMATIIEEQIFIATYVIHSAVNNRGVKSAEEFNKDLVNEILDELIEEKEGQFIDKE